MFQQLKLKKTIKYIIFKLSDDKTEIVSSITSQSKDYEDFLGDLPESECRWAVYDLEFELEEGGKRNKLVFYQWYVVFNQTFFLQKIPHSHKVCSFGADGAHFIFLFPPSFCLNSFFVLFSNVCDNDAPRLRLRVRSPDSAKIKDKMVTASSREALRRSLQGIAIEIQGTDISEVAYETGGFVFLPSPSDRPSLLISIPSLGEG